MAVRKVQPEEHHDKGPQLMHLHSLQDQEPKHSLHDPVIDGHGEELKRAEVPGLLQPEQGKAPVASADPAVIHLLEHAPIPSGPAPSPAIQHLRRPRLWLSKHDLLPRANRAKRHLDSQNQWCCGILPQTNGKL
jgi:hypothetical protein